MFLFLHLVTEKLPRLVGFIHHLPVILLLLFLLRLEDLLPLEKHLNLVDLSLSVALVFPLLHKVLVHLLELLFLLYLHRERTLITLSRVLRISVRVQNK